jgi:hypothetical protein
LWLLALSPLHNTHQQLDAAWHADHVHDGVLWRLLRCCTADHMLCDTVLQDMRGCRCIRERYLHSTQGNVIVLCKAELQPAEYHA